MMRSALACTVIAWTALASCGTSEPARVRTGAPAVAPGSIGSAGAGASSEATRFDRPQSRSQPASRTRPFAADRAGEVSVAQSHPDHPDAYVPAIPAEPVLSVEPWIYDDAPGVVVTLPHHRLRSTRTDDLTLRTLPLLLVEAIERYRRPLGDQPDFAGEPALTLPAVDPARPLEVYLLRTRAQWRSLTRSLLGAQAEPYLRITRGGYAWGGRSVLMDLSSDEAEQDSTATGQIAGDAVQANPISYRDTLLIAAHEGWHQYTQRTFRQPLPVWLEEGMATVMEGLVDQAERAAGQTSLRASTPQRGSPSSEAVLRNSEPVWPPPNPERRSDLADIVRANKLLPLSDLLSASPSELLNAQSRSTPTPAATGDGMGPAPESPAAADIDRYYAQVWAMTLWLMARESDLAAGPSHRASLRALLADASGTAGPTASAERVRLRVAESLGSDRARGLALVQGPAVFLTYFGPDLDAHDSHYRSFVLRLIGAGVGTPAPVGQSNR